MCSTILALAVDDTERGSADWAVYTSNAYAEHTDADSAAVAAWLETQALHPFIRETAAVSLDGLQLRAGEKVLDVGCGTGVLLEALAHAVGDDGSVVGLDHSEAFLDQARERIVGAGLTHIVTLVRGDAERLPFDSATFDAAHCERVLMHLERPEAAVAEMVRVVRPGGRVTVAEIHALGAGYDHPDPDAMGLMIRAAVAGIRNPAMGVALRRLFVGAGLEDVRVRAVVDVESELDPEEAQEFQVVADELSSRGTLDRDQANAAVQTLIDRSTAGHHCGYALMFVASGSVASQQVATGEPR